MKKIASCLLAASLTILSLSACGRPVPTPTGQAGPTGGPAQQANDRKISIVATTFPQYDWVRQILGDKIDGAELTLLLDDGVDLHSYQPTVEDIAKISNCDMFIYVGGASDAWVPAALETASNRGMVVINLLEVLGDAVKEEEIIEGMEHTHEHDHGEISPEDVHDRPLSDWAGSWTSVEKNLAGGDLDDYVTHQAEENGMEFSSQKNAYAQRWASEFETLTITESSISFGSGSSAYRYLGYELVESDHGVSVWYGFEAQDSTGSAPRYVAFSDHGTGGAHDDDHEDEHEDEEEEHEEHSVPHFHLRYGSESFEALTAIEDWAPTYFPGDTAGAEVAEAMGGHGHADEHELDEHVWLSLKNAQVICERISKELEGLDAQNAAVYAANAEAYQAKLAALDADYTSAVNTAACKVLLFGDRFPFRYFVDDYGLTYYAAFSGCSAETEASFETIAFLSGKTNELKLSNVMVIEGSDQSIAKTIIENTADKNQSILMLDSMQSVTAGDVSAGTTYLSVMEGNLEVLKRALA